MKNNLMCLRGLLLLVACLLVPVLAQAAPVQLKIAFLTQHMPTAAALSNLDPVLIDEGIQGARLGIADNNTTGQFTGQQYSLQYVELAVGADVEQAFERLLAEGYQYVVVDVPHTSLLALTKRSRDNNVLLFNVSLADGELRNENCANNLFHLIPSYEMQADALAQFMLKKRWNKWFLVKGNEPDDKRFAAAIKRSAKRFGIKIVAEKSWSFEHDTRRTAQAEIPVFTQGADYDVLLVADVKGLFGDYLPMNTWLPRPIAGTQGLVPRAWHRTHERWGAVQMQNRFYAQAGRWMNDVDYASWLAVRTVGEAVTRTNSSDSTAIKAFILSDKFSLAGFKGTKLTFRPWNQQLRQPVLLATPRSIVSVLPHKEFLHPLTYLDTLGYDKPESSCSFNQ
ncbi:branched-chain amino acid ABC transporter substrate-binding protein [Cycloclasticus sp. 46_83_sub15_T18]|nr:branched-chain amino acid ABC transporter substrate-binding protein [Cycloclasticus sp. 46_83_sub15_T18]